jgi:hypothetical protein
MHAAFPEQASRLEPAAWHEQAADQPQATSHKQSEPHELAAYHEQAADQQQAACLYRKLDLWTCMEMGARGPISVSMLSLSQHSSSSFHG